MDSPTRNLIEALHTTPHKCVVALAGGGTHALAMLLNVPGGSRTVLEAAVPYSEEALSEFLGQRPSQFCSAETSTRMAERAYERARWLAPGDLVVGTGCTATLATDRTKRGDHRFFISVRCDEGLSTYSLTLHKGSRDRAEEEAVLDAILLNALAEVCGIPQRVSPPLLPGEVVEVDQRPEQGPLAAVLHGSAPAVCVEPDGRMHAAEPKPCAFVAGAFNPVHHGHWLMAALAQQRSGLPVAFELSALNVDKPPLAVPEVRRRLAQFAWQGRVWVTRAPTFVGKARLFSGSVFVVGTDTAARIVQPRYYQDREEDMHAALEEIRRLGCRFLVCGRDGATGDFVQCDDLSFPAAVRDLFEGIPEREFRVAISSSLLRAQARAAVIARLPDSP